MSVAPVFYYYSTSSFFLSAAPASLQLLRAVARIIVVVCQFADTIKLVPKLLSTKLGSQLPLFYPQVRGVAQRGCWETVVKVSSRSACQVDRESGTSLFTCPFLGREPHWGEGGGSTHYFYYYYYFYYYFYCACAPEMGRSR